MKLMNLIFVGLLLLTVGLYAHAQVGSPAPVASPAVAQAINLAPAIQSPNADDVSSLIKGLGGLKGAGTLAIVALVCQGLMFFFRTSLASFAGVWQLVIINGLTLLLGVVSLKMQGMDWIAAIMNSQVLAAAQVYGHQVVSQIQKKPADEAAIAAAPQADAPKS